MNTIDIAKDLLKKGIALKDKDLINMANQLIENPLDNILDVSITSIESSPEIDISESSVLPAQSAAPAKSKRQTKKSVAVKQEAPPKQEKPKTARASQIDQFKMQKEKNVRKKRQPVTDSKWSNKFVDNRIEAKDEHNITPVIKLAKRDREKFKKVGQLCESCKQLIMIHPVHAREFFICDDCLANRSRGRT
jgi:hypothetical protein